MVTCSEILHVCKTLSRQVPHSFLSRFHMAATEPETQFLKITGSVVTQDREIAYKMVPGQQQYGVMYIPGFMSGKDGVKASSLHRFCTQHGYAYVRYDPAGIGESRGVALKDARLSHWVEDASKVLLELTDGPQLVVGSSLGCWIATYLAIRNPTKFTGLLLIAPGINLGPSFHEHLQKTLPQNILDKLDQGEVFHYSDPEYGEVALSYELFDDMNKYDVPVGEGELPISCPVRIIHGIKDKDVPYAKSVTLLKALQSQDVHLKLIKNGCHELSQDRELTVIYDTLYRMLNPKQSQL